MNQPTKTIAAAVLAGFSLVAAGFAAVPHGADSGAVEPVSVAPSVRIEAAFANAPKGRHPAIFAAAKRSQKGDLLVNAGCAGQYWPYVEAGCLVLGDDRGRPAVRTVTIGHQANDTTTVLVRMPAPQIASR